MSEATSRPRRERRESSYSDSESEDRRPNRSRRDERNNDDDDREARHRTRSRDYPRRRRSSSIAGSDAYDGDRHRKRYDDSNYRKRRRSRSRDAPRKRRSMSRDFDGSRDDRGFGKRHDEDERRFSKRYEQDARRRRRSRSDDRVPRRSRSPEPFKRLHRPLPSQQDAFQKEDLALVKSGPQPEKQKPNYGNTGKLAAASNTIQTAGQSIVLKYHEPSEARKPPATDQWRMYVFKGDEIVDTLELSQQSCWLFGREAAVVDVLLEHSSCSKQHAVVQFRYVEKRNEFGDRKGRVRPYILDLESANGTMVNENVIPEAKYVEVRDKDMVKFGHSSREYVLQLPPADSA